MFYGSLSKVKIGSIQLLSSLNLFYGSLEDPNFLTRFPTGYTTLRCSVSSLPAHHHQQPTFLPMRLKHQVYFPSVLSYFQLPEYAILFLATRYERGIPAAWYHLSSPFTLIPSLRQLLFIIPHPKAMQNELTS